MGDEQDTAEEFDPDELGDDPEGTLDYPADSYLGSIDPTRDSHVTDSAGSREWREERDPNPADEGGVRLSSSTDVWSDDEAEMLGDAQEADDLSAEEAAVHIAPEDAPLE